MRSNKNSVLTLLFSFVLFACYRQEQPSGDIGAYLEDVLKRKSYEREVDSFTIPDSINTRLIIAMYFEESPKSHSILLFDDTTRTTAKRIKYLGDTIEIDHLEKTNYNVFESRFDKSEYVIYDDYISHEHNPSANLKSVNHFSRIDNKRY